MINVQKKDKPEKSLTGGNSKTETSQLTNEKVNATFRKFALGAEDTAQATLNVVHDIREDQKKFMKDIVKQQQLNDTYYIKLALAHRQYGISLYNLNKLIKDGVLKSLKVGDSTYISRGELEGLIQNKN